MANIKISELNSHTGSNLHLSDILPIVDLDVNNDGNTSDAQTKRISIAELKEGIFASPTFTGIPNVPTAAANTNSTQIASTAFVTNAVSGISSGSTTINGLNDVTLTSLADGELLVSSSGNFINQTLAEVGIAPLADPIFTGNVKSDKLNIGSGNLYVDDGTATGNAFVKIGEYGSGDFFGKFGSENGAAYTLGVGSGGKIIEDMKVATFKITGNAFLNLFTAPKTLVAAPGASKAHIIHHVAFYVDHSGNKGTDAGGFDTNQRGCYSVGFSSTDPYASATSAFYSVGGLPRLVLFQEPGDFIWTGEPDEDYRVPINKPILLRSPTENNITDATKIPGGDHYIKIRYSTISTAADFSTIDGLITVS